MGLFSSKKKTYVGTVAQRVVEDDQLSESAKIGLTRGLLSGGDLVEHTLEEMIRSMGIRGESFYNKAASSYVLGLPSGTRYDNTAGRAEAQALIEASEGALVTVEYSRLCPPNYLHVAFMELVNQYGYDPVTNRLGALSGPPGPDVYLYDLYATLPLSLAEELDPQTTQTWEAAVAGLPFALNQYSLPSNSLRISSAPRYSDLYLEERIAVHYIWKIPTGLGGEGLDTTEVGTDLITIPFPTFEEGREYIHVKYWVENQPKYVMFPVGTGEYPTLDAAIESPPSEYGNYFPFIYFRFNKKSMQDPVYASEYTSSKKLVKKLGLDYDFLIENIHENPDIADVQQAMMVWAVPPVTQIAAENRYLFDYFNTQYYIQLAHGQAYTYYGQQGLAFSDRNNPSKFSTIIQDQWFKMALGHDGIHRRFKTGTIGRVGSCASAQGSRTVSIHGTGYEGEPLQMTDTVPVYYYRKQVTEGLYEELEVVRLMTTFYVTNKYYTLGDETNDYLLVPLDHAITENYSLPDREELYLRSLHFVFNSLIVVKVKWYQQSFWKFVFTAAAVVLTVMGIPGSELGQAMLAYSIGMATLEFVVLTALTTLAWMVAFSAAFKLFVKEVGGELALVLATVLAVAAGFQMIQSGSVQGAPWAEELLKASTGLTQASGEYFSTGIENLMGEMASFTKEMEEATQLLESTQKLLDTQSNLLSPFTLFGEKPEEYYARTVHAGNVGTLAFDAIEKYVEMSLTLPTLSQTLQDPVGLEGWDVAD